MTALLALEDLEPASGRWDLCLNWRSWAPSNLADSDKMLLLPTISSGDTWVPVFTKETGLALLARMKARGMSFTARASTAR